MAKPKGREFLHEDSTRGQNICLYIYVYSFRIESYVDPEYGSIIQNVDCSPCGFMAPWDFDVPKYTCC